MTLNVPVLLVGLVEWDECAGISGAGLGRGGVPVARVGAGVSLLRQRYDQI